MSDLSKKVVLLVILSIVSLGIICGTMTPYLLNASSGGGEIVSPPSNKKPQDNTSPKPVEFNPDDVLEENKFHAEHRGDIIWFVEMPFILYQSMIVTPNIYITALSGNRYYILGGAVGDEIYLVNLDIPYILYL